MSIFINRDLPNDEYNAAIGAANPSATNVFATMADLANAGLPHGVAAGTNNYTVTISDVTAYTDGDAYLIRFTNGNNDDSTININSLGVKTLTKKANVQVTGGDIVSGQEVLIVYDGTNFQCIQTTANQLFAYVTNDDSVTITKGQAVYAFGASGNRMSVKLANNTADATSAQTVGLVFSPSIAAGQKGFIITQGVVDGLNTGMYNPGDQLYLGNTAGSLTNIKPYAPNHLVYIGIVERANAGNGQIYVKPQNGYELDELHDVDLKSPGNLPANGQVLTYEASSQLWKAKPIVNQDDSPLIFVIAATDGPLVGAPVYNNGLANDGIGATLIAASNGVVSDGTVVGRIDTNYIPEAGDLILVKNQVNQFHNGVYEITDAGSASTPYILTRSVDVDTPAELYPLQINAFEGLVNGSKYFTQTNTAWGNTTPPVIGFDNIIFALTTLTTSPLQITFVDNVTSTVLPTCVYAAGPDITKPGVGAVLRATAPGTLVVSGMTAGASTTSLTQFTTLLVKNQAEPRHNGTYQVINPGSPPIGLNPGARWVLRRIDDLAAGFNKALRIVFCSHNISAFAGSYFTPTWNPTLTNKNIGDTTLPLATNRINYATFAAPNRLGRILFVTTLGNDANAAVGSLSNTYGTLEGAKNAAAVGDLIYVFPGTYTVTTTDVSGLAKDGVSYYFSPRTIVNKSTNGPIFFADSFVFGFNVYGGGNFNKLAGTGAIFGSNNNVVYGSVVTASVNAVGTLYTTGSKTTTGGSGTGLVINITAVGGGGTISTFTISNVGADYKVGDIVDVLQAGASGGKIRIDSIVQNSPSRDADISFEANDLFASNPADTDPSATLQQCVLYIYSTARCNIKFNNLNITTSRNGFNIGGSNVKVDMHSITTIGTAFRGSAGSITGIQNSNLTVIGNTISTSGNLAYVIGGATGTILNFNVNTISNTGTSSYSFAGNGTVGTFNVYSMGDIFGQAFGGVLVYLNGYARSVTGIVSLFGGHLGRISGVSGGVIQSAYAGLAGGNETPTTMTISGGLITLEMQPQDTTTGFAISGGIVTLNGNWTNDDMASGSDLTGGTLIINGDYEYGEPGKQYQATRYYGINVAGGTLIVNGAIRVNNWSTTDITALSASPIEFTYGKVILNGAILNSNVSYATPIRVLNQPGCVLTLSGGVAGTGYISGNKATTALTGSGTGLIVNVINANGITGTTVVATARGTGYAVGDTIQIQGGTTLATFTIASISSPELKIYSGGMNTNLVQNGGTLAGKKMNAKVTINSVASTSVTLNDLLLSGNLTFTESDTATYNTTALLAQRLVFLINANVALQLTASQDIPGTDNYFYVESDNINSGFLINIVAYANTSLTGVRPGMFAITPRVLGTIIEDIDVE